jgi:4-amino-4-deoxy-L-arabinose transferase-like glycosyltransferase
MMATTETVAEAAAGRVRRWGPELGLALLAGLVFLGFLGAVDLWGKREQRASAEAIDTLDHQHWLVAQIQGRPRLEKPPLPRWTIAALMTLTGRCDAWMVRLPAALSALGMVGLVYVLGTRLGGRSVGLASGLALCSMGFFISEMRQSGNDGPLAFFTTLALCAAWRRLHGRGTTVADDPADAGGRGWSLLFHAALGLGFLCKGPIVVLLAAVAVVPYLVTVRRLGLGLRRLADGWGLVVFLVLALSWPAPVLLSDPNALKLWMFEMGQKTGSAGIGHSHYRLLLAVDWPWMTLPWAVVATMAAGLPLAQVAGAAYRPRIWFPWWWAVGNLAMFCFWSVAKPSYFLPCLPAAALLVGLEWVWITRTARLDGRAGVLARGVLQCHWMVLFAGAMVMPVVVHQQMPSWQAWASVFAMVMAAGVVASAWAWRRGSDAGALAPLTAALAVGVLIGYGVLAPRENGRRGHRELAAALDRTLPPEARTVMFFHELDEGLWFYLRDRDLEPVPGSRPAYNDAFRVAEDLRAGRIERDPDKRIETRIQRLVDWLRRPEHPSRYVLIRREHFERFAATLTPLVVPLYGEHDKQRNEVVLLRLRDQAAVTVAGPVAADTRRQ